MKDSAWDVGSDSKSAPYKGTDKWKNIIDAEPNAIVVTTKIYKIEPEDPEEGEHLFHS